MIILMTLIYFFVDVALAKWISHYQHLLKPLTKLVYVLFNGAVVLPITGVLVFFSFKVQRLKTWKNWLIQLFCALFVGQMVLAIGKILVGRARPYQALLQGYQSFEPLHLNNAFFSFPSGHTLNIILISGFLSLKFPEKTKWIFLFGFVLSFFRVLGLDHFISDWLLTAYLAGLILVLTKYYFAQKQRLGKKNQSEDSK